MSFIIRVILTALAVIGVAYLLPGAHVQDYVTALIVALVLAVLNAFLKPILVVLTIPITIITLGLFLFVINAALILLAAHFIDGFHVDGFWWALLFSVILSVAVSIMESIIGSGKRKRRW